ncbi:MAG: triose-phosphate isomerase [Chloroflexota bacterium]
MDRQRMPLVAGNWKMNPPARDDAMALGRALAAELGTLEDAEVVVCPPAIWLDAIAAELRGTRVAIGAQTMHAAERGAYTGELSPTMLREVATHVIIGHCERRQYDGETDEGVAAKVASAVAHGLVPIAAIGELSEERRAGATEQVIERQLRAAISGLAEIDGSRLVIAYEPVWAIGTGEAASPADAQHVASLIRRILAEADATAAPLVRILYGGSVSPHNAASFFSEPDVDGALVGGASLDAVAFGAIARAAAETP